MENARMLIFMEDLSTYFQNKLKNNVSVISKYTYEIEIIFPNREYNIDKLIKYLEEFLISEANLKLNNYIISLTNEIKISFKLTNKIIKLLKMD